MVCWNEDHAISKHGEVFSPVRATDRHRDYCAGVTVEPEVVVIPAGDALLDDPPRTIHVNVFAIARLLVTNAELSEFAAATSHAAAKWTKGPPSHPAEGLTWADAVAYCRWLSVATGRIYRLPDEREWEKAARGVSGRRWPWGNDDDPARANVREAKIGTTSPVGRFPEGASPEGVLDLIGNVREWTNTWADGGRVLRGGSYMDGFLESIPSRRLRPTSELLGHGFRVVRSMTGR
jgi:formylglycine-generating enzyme required for sulfatase activity